MSDQDSSPDRNPWREISRRLRNRAAVARIEAFGYMTLVVVVAGTVVWFFAAAADPVIYWWEEMRKGVLSASARWRESEGVVPTIAPPDPTAQVMSQVGQWALKIGAVILAVYLIQIIVGFARYQYRMYYLLSDCGDAVDLADGDIDKLEKIRRALSTDIIAFDRIPESPSEKMLDAVKDIVSSVASSKKG